MRIFLNSAPPNYRPLSPEEAQEIVPLSSRADFRIMFAGNIGEAQDFDTIIEAADRLRDCHGLTWTIVGSGRDLDRVRSRIKDFGLEDRFSFLGRFPEDSMPDIFAQADVMLVTLKNQPIWNLTVPYKVQCYLACGKPIVAALGGEGARIVRESGAGIVASPSDPESLAEAVLKMMKSTPEERGDYADAARRYFEAHFSRENTYNQFHELLRKLARDHEN